MMKKRLTLVKALSPLRLILGLRVLEWHRFCLDWAQLMSECVLCAGNMGAGGMGGGVPALLVLRVLWLRPEVSDMASGHDERSCQWQEETLDVRARGPRKAF